MTIPEEPLVSVVIPSRDRPQMVVEAVNSALTQTVANIEVIVVLDGDNREAAHALNGAFQDARLSIMALPQSLGNAGARNVGIRAARARWIALLDDDDLWAPEKLALQLRTAERSSRRYPIVSCRLTAINESQSFVWPRFLPTEGQPLSEYLFCRRTPATGDGVVQTSTILAPAELFHRVRFEEKLRRYVDVDWLLRAERLEGAGVEFVNENQPLVTWRIENRRARVTNGSGWRWDLEWIRRRRHLVTDRAYGAFLLTLPSVRAARDRDWAALPVLLRESMRGGRPGTAELIYHLGNFFLPFSLRNRLAGLVETVKPLR